ncbi:hypothetical protein [Microcoleus sp. B4-C1]
MQVDIGGASEVIEFAAVDAEELEGGFGGGWFRRVGVAGVGGVGAG